MMYDSIIFLFLLYLVDAANHKLRIWHIITSNLLHHYINDDVEGVLKDFISFFPTEFSGWPSVTPWFRLQFAISLRMQSMQWNMRDCFEMIKSFLRDPHSLNKQHTAVYSWQISLINNPRFLFSVYIQYSFWCENCYHRCVFLIFLGFEELIE